MAEQLRVGQPIALGWNGAKQLDYEGAAYVTVRVEAVGFDWVVVRTESGVPLAATFEPGDDMKTELES